MELPKRALTIDDYYVESPQLDIDDAVLMHMIPGGAVIEIPISCVAESVVPGSEDWDYARQRGRSRYGERLVNGHMLPFSTLAEKSLFQNGGETKNAVSALIVCNYGLHPLGMNVQLRRVVPHNYRYAQLRKKDCANNGNGQCQNGFTNGSVLGDFSPYYFSDDEISFLLDSGSKLYGDPNSNLSDDDMISNISTFAWGIHLLNSTSTGLLKIPPAPVRLAPTQYGHSKQVYPETIYRKPMNTNQDIKSVVQGLMLAASAAFTGILRQSQWPFLFRNSQQDWRVITPDNTEDLIVDRTIATNPLRDFLHLVNQKIILDKLEGAEVPPFTPEELEQIVIEYNEISK